MGLLLRIIMRITPEHVANLIFAVSQLRYFERELVMQPNDELQDITIRWQFKVDQVLIEMGVEEFISRKSLIETIKLEYESEKIPSI